MKNRILYRVIPVLVSVFIFISGVWNPRGLLFFQDFLLLPKPFLLSSSLNDQWVSLDNLDPEAIELLLEIEDRNFFFHGGYSPSDMQSAFLGYLKGKKLRGASTVTQQLSRTFFLTRRKTAARKIREIEIAVEMENHMSKKEILEYYINNIYWGHGYYGLGNASRYFFQKDPETLNALQLKILFSILKKPDRYDRQDIKRIYSARKNKI